MRAVLTIAAVAAILPSAAPAAPATWAVDKAASSVRFSSSFSGTPFTGAFRRWDAKIAFDPKTLATPEAFAADPALVWGWYEWRRAEVQRVRPNPGHEAEATIEAHIPGTVLITQNVDDLHERAGSRTPIHLHGSLFAPRCSECGRPAPLPVPPAPPTPPGAQSQPSPAARPASTTSSVTVNPVRRAAAPAQRGASPAEPAAATAGPEGELDGRIAPPSCAGCGASVRPGVVWFGEQLPTDALSAATEAAFGCDLLFTVGTSGLVYPAAEIPYVAARSGATVVQINPEPTALDAVADVNLRGTAARILPELVARAWGDR